MSHFPAYDAGLLNDYGGGNVEWWQDYIRAELGRAHEHYEAIAGPSLEAVGHLPDPAATLAQVRAFLQDLIDNEVCETGAAEAILSALGGGQ